MFMAHIDSLQLIWICVVSPSDQNIIWKHEGRCCALHVHVFVILEKKIISTPLPRRTFWFCTTPTPLEIQVWDLSFLSQRVPVQSSFSWFELHIVDLFVCSQDEDRIFTNLYGRHDWKLSGAIKRVMIGKGFMRIYLYVHCASYTLGHDSRFIWVNLESVLKLEY